jgi:hypothetical protein
MNEENNYIILNDLEDVYNTINNRLMNIMYKLNYVRNEDLDCVNRLILIIKNNPNNKLSDDDMNEYEELIYKYK